jgi:opacity protein-like surface antigen
MSGFVKSRALAMVAAVAIILATAPASAASVKEVFENYGLLGTFSQDCSKAPSENNGYIVYRAVDAAHVQRDTMNGETSRIFAYIADTASGKGPNEIDVSGTTTAGKPYSYRIRTDGQRHRIMTWTEGGVTSIVDGIWKDRNNYKMPWVTKCSEPGK